jgi:uncharacterized membrane protein
LCGNLGRRQTALTGAHGLFEVPQKIAQHTVQLGAHGPEYLALLCARSGELREVVLVVIVLVLVVRRQGVRIGVALVIIIAVIVVIVDPVLGSILTYEKLERINAHRSGAGLILVILVIVIVVLQTVRDFHIDAKHAINEGCPNSRAQFGAVVDEFTTVADPRRLHNLGFALMRGVPVKERLKNVRERRDEAQ